MHPTEEGQVRWASVTRARKQNNKHKWDGVRDEQEPSLGQTGPVLGPTGPAVVC